MTIVLSKKQLVSNYNKLSESYSKRHETVKSRMEKRRIESADMKKAFNAKTSSLNRLRNK